MKLDMNVKVGEYQEQPGLIACDHCGIVALDTPAFGWKRWHEDGDPYNPLHHCPQAVQYNDWISQGLVHNKAPDEAIEYGYWPVPDMFWLVNLETHHVTGPFIGHDEALDALADIKPDENRAATIVYDDAEHHVWEVARDIQVRNGH